MHTHFCSPDYLIEETTLTPPQKALARSNGYALFGRIYLNGVTAEILPHLLAFQEFAALLDGDVDVDHAAADHYQLFGHTLFPYESIYLDGEGLLGGSLTNAVQRFLGVMGYGGLFDDSSPDHLGHELGGLAYLCRQEAELLQRAETSEAAGIRASQREFLESHLLRWLLPALIAIEQHGSRFYCAMAALTLDLMGEHYEELIEGAAEPLYQFKLPSPPALLENDATGLREIARYLVTPPYSGMVMSRESITRMARRLQLPRGFGNRQQMWLNLARTAIQYDKMGELLDDLGAHLKEWRASYNRIASEYPQLGTFAEAWIGRVDLTAKIITQVREQSLTGA